MVREELKDCPFCGEKGLLCEGEIDGSKVYYVYSECGISTGASEDKDRVIELWNNRSEELLPCPFCGGKAIESEVEIDGENFLTVMCEECGMSSIANKDEARVKAAWNARTVKKQE